MSDRDDPTYMTLLERLKNQDMTAFDEIYKETSKSVFVAIKMIVRDEDSSQDLMQETYLDFLENVKKLKDDSNINAFLITSAKNKAINYYKKRKYEKEFADSLVTFSTSHDSILDTGLIDKIKENLNDDEYQVFMLHVLGEYTFKEISVLIKKPIGTLTWLYQEVRKKLLDVFGGDKK